MKRNILFGIIFLLLVLWIMQFRQDRVAAEANQSHLEELNRVSLFARTLKAQHAQITGWNIYAREPQDTHASKLEVKKGAATIQAKLDDYKWQVMPARDGAFGWVGIKKAKLGHAQWRVSYIAYPNGNGYQTVILYQGSGKSFIPAQWGETRDEMSAEIARIFNGQEHLYSCVSAYRNDKMKRTLLEEGKRYLKLFSAIPVEQLQEKTFVSISAYNGAWNNAIDTSKKKMNIQAALRNDGDRTIIVLGSPIITVEY